MCKYLPTSAIVDVQCVPLLKIKITYVILPNCTTNIGDGPRPVDIHFIQIADAFSGMGKQSDSLVVSTQRVYSLASSTRDRLQEKVDRKLRQQLERLK